MYPEVRKWWIDYLEKHLEPIPVETLELYSPDIRLFVENSIYELDLILKNREEKRYNYAENRKRTLIDISTYLT